MVPADLNNDGSRGCSATTGSGSRSSIHGIAEERLVTEGMLRLGQELGIGVVATNDAHYLRREDAESHDVLLASARAATSTTRSASASPARSRTSSPRRRWRRSSRTHPEVLANTQTVADLCEFDFEKKYFLPGFPRPAGYATDEALLDDLARAGRRAALRRRRSRPRSRSGSTTSSASSTGPATPATSSSSRTSSRPRASAGFPVGPGPRLGGRLARRLRARHHRRLPAQVRPAVRALPEPRARVDARHRRRLLLRAPRRGDRVRAPEVRAASRSARSSPSGR